MRNIVLIAHDAKKRDIIEWARFNREALISKRLFATRSTGEEIISGVGLPVNLLRHGPEGGDAQVAAIGAWVREKWERDLAMTKALGPKAPPSVAAEALREGIGAPLPPDERPDYDRSLATLREALEGELFAAAWADGKAMTLEQAIERAMAEGPQTSDVYATRAECSRFS